MVVYLSQSYECGCSNAFLFHPCHAAVSHLLLILTFVFGGLYFVVFLMWIESWADDLSLCAMWFQIEAIAGYLLGLLKWTLFEAPIPVLMISDCYPKMLFIILKKCVRFLVYVSHYLCNLGRSVP